MESKPVPLSLAPGINITDTEYFAQGRYVACDHVRFVDGQPEKIGGWEQWNEDGDELPDVCRSALFWQDFSYNIWHAFGTAHRLWVFDTDKDRTNITPYVVTGATLTDPFSTTDTSTTVNVADVAHGLVVGQYVYFDNATAVGGITIDGEYIVTLVVDADNYQIEHSSAATSTAGPGGGTVDIDYELGPGGVTVTAGGGWGISTWGTGTWGSFHASTTYLQYPRYWSMDKYGQYLYVLPSGGTLYKWELNTANRAVAVTNAPATGLYMFITYQRIIVILGVGGDFMNMAWCDDDDPTDWTPSAINTANTRKLQEGSRMVAGARLSQDINLVWTDLSVYLMQYSGSNNVYATRSLGLHTGLVGPGAFVIAGGVAYWMAGNSFMYFNGSVQEVPSMPDIRGLFDDLSLEYRVNVTCFHNEFFNEIWWVYTSRNATENDKYAAMSLKDWTWVTGTIDRSVFRDITTNGVNTILGVDYSGVIHAHEVGKNADGAALPWSITTSYFDLQDGEVTVDIDGYIPDMKRQEGTIDVRFQSKEYPEDAADLHDETKQMAETDGIVDFRTSGRIIKLTLSQDEIDGDFAMGRQRIEAGVSGNRRG